MILPLFYTVTFFFKFTSPRIFLQFQPLQIQLSPPNIIILFLLRDFFQIPDENLELPFELLLIKMPNKKLLIIEVIKKRNLRLFSLMKRFNHLYMMRSILLCWLFSKQTHLIKEPILLPVLYQLRGKNHWSIFMV